MLNTSADDDDDLQWSEGLLAIDEDADPVAPSDAIPEGNAPDALIAESGTEEKPSAPVGKTVASRMSNYRTFSGEDHPTIGTDGEEQNPAAIAGAEQTTNAVAGEEQAAGAIADEEQTTTPAANKEEEAAIAEGKKRPIKTRK